MEKVICDICGSEFDESLAQCPICGCAKKEANAASAEAAYVKGGRFSKSNVRRRMRPETGTAASESVREYVKNNDDRNVERQAAKEEREERDDAPRSNRPLVFVVILLLLAIIAVSLYIIIAFGGSDEADDGTTGPTSSIQIPDDDGPCALVQFNVEEITLDNMIPNKKLTVIVEPVNTLDTLSFESSDPTIVDVDAFGNLVALKKGTVTVTVRCGSQSDTITVISQYEFPTTPTTQPTTPPTTKPTTPPNQFIVPDGAKVFDPINVTVKAEEANLRDRPGTGSSSNILKMVYSGHQLTITMEYVADGYTWVLSNEGWVVKTFLSFPAGTETLSLNRTDFTLTKKDNKWNLYSGGLNVSDIAWSSSNTSVVTVNNGIVTAVGNGSATITAEYNGQKATCKVYVNGF